jgi:DNA polymerase-4
LQTDSKLEKPRKIIHMDLDAFYCAVEEKRDDSLIGKPFAVGGRPNQRGVVASCSYAARKQGIRSAMPMAHAIRLCPELIVISGHFNDYRENSRGVMAILREVTPLVQQLSIDEAFLDVSDHEEEAEAVALAIQQDIKEKLSLPCSMGVAANKLVAKIANDFGKSQFTGEGPPGAITVVPNGTESDFLAPLPVRALWGIGPKTEERLGNIGITTIGELASADTAMLSSSFGKHGHDMAQRAQGIDNSPISTSREAKSISQEITFVRDVYDEKLLRESVHKQAARVSSSLINKKLTASTIRIKIRWPDFTTLTRQSTITQPTNDAEIIGKVAWKLTRKVWKKGKGVRLIGVGVSGLGEPPKQMQFWDIIEEDKE